MKVINPGKGVLEGVTLLDSVTQKPKCHRFSRVPYATPPVGHYRWRKPQPLPESFSYGSDAAPGQYRKPSSVCPQPRVFGRQSPRHDEDCLQSNIWVPLGKPPKDGWPVLFYIHGGFLQFGSNNYDDPSALIAETDVKCIIVSPGYRLGLFGFLASRELWEDGSPAANFGFWDQRLALEWTYENIRYFGGNPENITVGGLSAGSYATFHQLAYDIGPNAREQIIRRVFQLSNGCGVQPKVLSEVQQQFDDLLYVLGVSSSDSPAEKVKKLRSLPADLLVTAVDSMKQKFFRPILDGDFMSEDLFPSIFSGRFGERLNQLGIQTVIGDLTQEFHGYKNVYPPTSYHSLIDRLSWDYPRHVAEAVSTPYKSSVVSLSKEYWKDIFGRLYADMQIHSTMRGYVNSISMSLPISTIHRYRIDWRTKSVDKKFPREFGATHTTDMSIWFFGNGDTLEDSEKVFIREWLKPIAAFIDGRKVAWGTKSVDQVRYITADGKIEVLEDEVWKAKLPIWEVTREVTKATPLSKPRL
ncbi:carboxylesterase-like protein [Mollisia scopiformis]|uniref:Carboxylic ester hydrolase n=1 Tax=Mollisia scopiformis TaxID=149040 RepID=A0A194XM41_MOLSC|nr:carboxylesterase-like protein [Mollisia scopiformis]KUJ20832.1 carboxylesteras-like protein [Mollisia scopiformis]